MKTTQQTTTTTYIVTLHGEPVTHINQEPDGSPDVHAWSKADAICYTEAEAEAVVEWIGAGAAAELAVCATITEHGNGLPSIGELCYDASTDTVYTIIGWDGSDHISTHGAGCGNSVGVLIQARGSASDTTAEEWDSIEGNNYGVVVE